VHLPPSQATSAWLIPGLLEKMQSRAGVDSSTGRAYHHDGLRHGSDRDTANGRRVHARCERVHADELGSQEGEAGHALRSESDINSIEAVYQI